MQRASLQRHGQRAQRGDVDAAGGIEHARRTDEIAFHRVDLRHVVGRAHECGDGIAPGDAREQRQRLVAHPVAHTDGLGIGGVLAPRQVSLAQPRHEVGVPHMQQRRSGLATAGAFVELVFTAG